MTIEDQVRYLDVGLRMLGVTLDNTTLIKIVKLNDLIKSKKGNTTMNEVLEIRKNLSNK